jgi:hypothetical protein
VFSINESGLIAAYATQVSPTGAVTIQPVFSIQNGAAAPVPIDVSAGQTYLTFFGSGLTEAAVRNALSGYFQVTYVGADPAFPGVEQVNLLVPSSLVGSGYMPINLGGPPVYFVIK